MGVPTSEVGYTPAMPRREDHEVHKRACGGIGPKKNIILLINIDQKSSKRHITRRIFGFVHLIHA